MKAIDTVVQKAHRNEKATRTFITICGIGMALVPLLIGAFLFIKRYRYILYIRSQCNGILIFPANGNRAIRQKAADRSVRLCSDRFTGHMCTGTAYFPAFQHGFIYLHDGNRDTPATPPDPAGYRTLYGYPVCCIWFCRDDRTHSGAPETVPYALGFFCTGGQVSSRQS